MMNLIKTGRLVRTKAIDLNVVKRCVHSFEQNKSLVELVSQNQEVRYIKSVSNFGFRLNNNMFAVGPIVIFNEILLSWNIKCPKEINPHSLSLFRMFVPKFEVLIIGVGDSLKDVHSDLQPYLSLNRVPHEILTTKDAAKLYNMMVMDKRNVVAALVPQQNIGAPTENRLDMITNWDKMVDARILNSLINDRELTRIWFKYWGEFEINLKEKYISKEELKLQIAAKNEALLKQNKKKTFNELIADERGVIQHDIAEKAYLDRAVNILEPHIDPKEEKEKPPPIDPNQKLIK